MTAGLRLLLLGLHRFFVEPQIDWLTTVERLQSVVQSLGPPIEIPVGTVEEPGVEAGQEVEGWIRRSACTVRPPAQGHVGQALHVPVAIAGVDDRETVALVERAGIGVLLEDVQGHPVRAMPFDLVEQ